MLLQRFLLVDRKKNWYLHDFAISSGKNGMHETLLLDVETLVFKHFSFAWRRRKTANHHDRKNRWCLHVFEKIENRDLQETI